MSLQFRQQAFIFVNASSNFKLWSFIFVMRSNKFKQWSPIFVICSIIFTMRSHNFTHCSILFVLYSSNHCQINLRYIMINLNNGHSFSTIVQLNHRPSNTRPMIEFICCTKAYGCTQLFLEWLILTKICSILYVIGIIKEYAWYHGMEKKEKLWILDIPCFMSENV